MASLDLEYLRLQKEQNRQLLKKVKDGDWLMVKQDGKRFGPSTYQLFQVTNVRENPDMPSYWIDYDIVDGLVYTNKRHPKDLANKPLSNCWGVVEIVPEPLVERYIKHHNMWESDKYLLEPITI